jgi:hypothetical protein
VVLIVNAYANGNERYYILLEKKYNVMILTEQLRAANISTAGNCSDTGIVWSDDGKEIQTRPDVAAILAAHDPDVILPEPPTVDERLEALELVTDMLMDGGA